MQKLVSETSMFNFSAMDFPGMNYLLFWRGRLIQPEVSPRKEILYNFIHSYVESSLICECPEIIALCMKVCI